MATKFESFNRRPRIPICRSLSGTRVPCKCHESATVYLMLQWMGGLSAEEVVSFDESGERVEFWIVLLQYGYGTHYRSWILSPWTLSPHLS